MTRKITIHDIAKEAGVSKATVSRVLNHKPDVDPVTRERILRIMNEQGFVPSIVATGLAGGRSRMIGVLIPALTWPLIPEIMRGVAEIIDHTSYELVLYSINSSNHEKDRSDVLDRILATRLVAGLLAIYPGHTAQHLQALYKQGVPVVMLDDQNLQPADIPWVGADQCVGAYEATLHLIRQGHRHIAHIQGPLRYQVSLDRYRGYCQALADAGIELDPDLVVQGDFMSASGKECASYLFEREGHRPTAIFAGNDLMAYGVLAATEQYGLRVPEDVALVGFDDIELSSHMQPALTTVRQPLYEMGQSAIEMLLELLDAPGPTSHEQYSKFGFRPSNNAPIETAVSTHIQLATNLVVRSSCGTTRNLSFLQ